MYMYIIKDALGYRGGGGGGGGCWQVNTQYNKKKIKVRTVHSISQLKPGPDS